MAVEKFGTNYVVGGTEKAVVSFETGDRNETGILAPTPFDKKRKFASWFPSDFVGRSGLENTEPSTLLNLIANNNIQLPLLQTNIDFCLGDGIGLFKKVLVNGKVEFERVIDNDIESWLLENVYEEKLRMKATDLYMLGNCFSEMVFSNSKEVISTKHVMPTEARSSVVSKDGIIDTYYIGDWVGYKSDIKNKVPIDSYDRLSVNDNAKFKKAILHGKKYFPGQHHYGIPVWWGVKKWIDLANQIPLFHLSGLTKGYNLRWHIQIPSNYFDQYPVEKRREMEEEIMGNMDKFLSGVENVGKAFVSQYTLNQPEWKISSLNAEIYDDAYKDIFSHSNTALSSANNIDPSLAGYDTSGKLSSGSEKRNSYIIHTTLKTPYYRNILLRELNIIKKHNKWDKGIIFKFLDTELQTLDVNKSGSQSVVQTSDTNTQ